MDPTLLPVVPKPSMIKNGFSPVALNVTFLKLLIGNAHSSVLELSQLDRSTYVSHNMQNFPSIILGVCDFVFQVV